MTAKSIPDRWMDDQRYAPQNSKQYDRQPDLDVQEREALAQAIVLCTGDNETRLPQPLHTALLRLLQPLQDILTCLGASQKYCSAPIQVILQDRK